LGAGRTPVKALDTVGDLAVKPGKRDESIEDSVECGELTRTDARLIFSMISGSRDSPVPVTPETQIGGLSMREIMEHADVGLYLDLKPSDPSEASLVSMLVRTHKAAIDHFNQAAKYELTPHLLEVHSKFALKSAALFGLFFDRLEKYREKKLKAAFGHGVNVSGDGARFIMTRFELKP